MRPKGPYSTPDSLLKKRGHTRHGRIVRAVRDDLTAHVGGLPSATQRVLIDRAAMLTLRLAIMDAEQADNVMQERNGRQYLAWTNSLTRLMRQLGPAVPLPIARPPTLPEHLAARAAAAAAKAAAGT